MSSTHAREEEEKQQVDAEEAKEKEEDEAVAVEMIEANDDDDDEHAPSNNNNKKKKRYQTLPADAPYSARLWEVITTFWPLGLVAFGGPQAHVAILRDALVTQRDWLDEDAFLELFAIGQGLPGPSSTQLVVSTALSRAGPLGGLIALGFWLLPGFVVLTVCGALIANFVDPNVAPWWLIGLPPAAIALVFKAFYGFGLKLDSLGIILALCSALVAVLLNNDARISPQSSQWVFPTVLALGALVTLVDSKRSKPWSTYNKPMPGWEQESEETIKRIGIPMWFGAALVVLWLGVLALVVSLVNRRDSVNVYLEIFEITYRIGSLLFGGGQVVLPMLQDEVVPNWMTKQQFLQGLGLAQSMPGPLFNFAAYLGAVYQGVPGAFVANIGLFGPGILLIFAVTPFWAKLRHNMTFRALLKGLNATAIGLVGAACITLWEAAVGTAADAMVFSISGTLAIAFNVPAPLCILAGGIVGAILHPDALDLGQQPYCVDQGYILLDTDDAAA
jgi:chromate transporter